MAGAGAGIVAQHVGAISPELEFGIVVAGALIAAALLGLSGWLWKRFWSGPRLVLSCGDGFEYDKNLGKNDPFALAAIGEQAFRAAFVKHVIVRETRGRSAARNVVVRVTDVAPPHPVAKEAVELPWANHQEAAEVRPHGHQDAVLQAVFFYMDSDGQPGWRCTPVVFEHDPNVEFTLEVLVDGRKHTSGRFCLQDAWNPDRIDAADDAEGWPPNTLGFSSVTRLSR